MLYILSINDWMAKYLTYKKKEFCNNIINEYDKILEFEDIVT